jgi:MaoC like domain
MIENSSATASPKYSKIIATRRFSLQDQHLFAKFSGDSNPIHVDPVAARRTMAGRCVVHGMHTLLWALNELSLTERICVAQWKANFWKPVFLDDEIICLWDLEANEHLPIVRPSVANIPKELSFAECTAMVREDFFIYGDPDLAKFLFPSFCQNYGSLVAAEIGSCSELVGMRCPGLHSLFSSLNFNIRRSTNSAPVFGVVKSSAKFNLLKIAVNGLAIYADIEAFLRPAPAINLSLVEVAAIVSKGEFHHVDALIIGGSRGLGELVAKCIVAGGGRVTITYSVGKQEAKNLSEEIFAFGGTAQIAQLTVTPESAAPDTTNSFNQMYFFATPKILGKRSLDFDAQLFEQFCDIYVDGFTSLCKDLLKKQPACAIFYPSTIYVENPPAEFEHYAKAKAMGEAACRDLQKTMRAQIFAPRLPRMVTDQTQAIVGSKSDDPLTVMLPLLRTMANL